MTARFDVAVIGAVNAGTLTMQMTRATLIPYALRAHEMWMNMPAWCAGGDVLATACPGLSVAFTDAEAAMLEERARIRREAGAPIELIDGRAAWREACRALPD